MVQETNSGPSVFPQIPTTFSKVDKISNRPSSHPLGVQIIETVTSPTLEESQRKSNWLETRSIPRFFLPLPVQSHAPVGRHTESETDDWYPIQVIRSCWKTTRKTTLYRRERITHLYHCQGQKQSLISQDQYRLDKFWGSWKTTIGQNWFFDYRFVSVIKTLDGSLQKSVSFRSMISSDCFPYFLGWKSGRQDGNCSRSVISRFLRRHQFRDEVTMGTVAQVHIPINYKCLIQKMKIW